MTRKKPPARSQTRRNQARDDADAPRQPGVPVALVGVEVGHADQAGRPVVGCAAVAP